MATCPTPADPLAFSHNDLAIPQATVRLTLKYSTLELGYDDAAE